MDSTLAYDLALFLHIAGVLALYVSLTLEGVALRGIRGSTTGEAARTWLNLMAPLRLFGIGSLVLILLPGLYLAANIEPGGDWIGAGLLGFLAILILGAAITGRRMAVVGPALGRAQGPLSGETLLLAHDRQLAISHAMRSGLGLGVVLLMTVKPDFLPSLVVLAVAAVAGIIAGRVVAGSPQPVRVASAEAARIERAS